MLICFDPIDILYIRSVLNLLQLFIRVLIFRGVVGVTKFFTRSHPVHLAVLVRCRLVLTEVKLRSLRPMPLVLMISGYLRA